MPNIPFIQRRDFGTFQLRRAGKLTPGEQSTSRSPTIKRRLERRRQNTDRRQHQVNVVFDRRQKEIHRRKNQLNQQISAKSVSLNDTIGKNINTTA